MTYVCQSARGKQRVLSTPADDPPLVDAVVAVAEAAGVGVIAVADAARVSVGAAVGSDEVDDVIEQAKLPMVKTTSRAARLRDISFAFVYIDLSIKDPFGRAVNQYKGATVQKVRIFEDKLNENI